MRPRGGRWAPGLTLAFAVGCGDDVRLGPAVPSTTDAGTVALPDASGVATSGLAELLAGDPLRYTYDFLRADYGTGSTPSTSSVSSPGPQLEYSHYVRGELTVAFLGSEVGAIVDLGTDAEVAAGLGVAETVAGGEGYTGLAYANGTFNLQNAQELLDTPVSALRSAAHALPGQGHVYVLRLVDQDWRPPLDVVVKLLVVSLTDQRDVSFEWTRLR